MQKLSITKRGGALIGGSIVNRTQMHGKKEKVPAVSIPIGGIVLTPEEFCALMRDPHAYEAFLAMQQLLSDIANGDMHTEVGEGNATIASGQSIWARAKEILAGMVRPRGPSVRAQDRAVELEVLAVAYRLTCGVNPVESPHVGEARALMVEALKAWERAHPPAALDPLLGP